MDSVGDNIADRIGLYTFCPGNGRFMLRKIVVACAMSASMPEMAVVEAILRAFNDREHNERLCIVP